MVLGTIESGTTPKIVFALVDSDDIGASGLTNIVCKISTNGGAFASTTNSVVEISDGFYSVTLTATETGTEGPIALIAYESGATKVLRAVGQVVATTSSVTLATGEHNKIADHVLRRSLASARASSDGDTVSFRSLLGLAAKAVNRVAFSGTTLNIYAEDDATVFGTQTASTTGSAVYVDALDTN